MLKIYASINFIVGTNKNFIIADGLEAMLRGAVNDGQAEPRGTPIVNFFQGFSFHMQPRPGLDGDGKITIPQPHPCGDAQLGVNHMMPLWGIPAAALKAKRSKSEAL